MAIKFKTKYDVIGKETFEPVSKLPSLTDESFKDECDIEFIISNFVQRGIEPPEHQITYGKNVTSDDFQKAMYTVAECKTAFEELPATEKERFGGQVTNFLEFISDPKNLRESYEKGYINPDSVNLSDVYPQGYIKDITGAIIPNDYGSSEPSADASVMPTSGGSENPTQTT